MKYRNIISLAGILSVCSLTSAGYAETGIKWEVDRTNRVILRDGHPYFPYGIIMHGGTNDVAAAAAMGYNTVHTWAWGQKPEQARICLEAAEKYGVNVILELGGYSQGIDVNPAEFGLNDEQAAAVKNIMKNPSPKKVNTGLVMGSAAKLLSETQQEKLLRLFYDQNIANYAETIRLASGSPALIGYDLFDEPIKLSWVFGRPLYRLVRERDGNHPAFVIYSSSIPAGDEYVDWTDCLGADIYWTPGNEGLRGSVNKVAKYTWLLNQRAAERGQAVSVIPMAEYWSGIRKRAILRKEQFCQTYLAVIHGAKAIIYFRWPFIEQVTEDTHKDLAREMQVIGPIAVTPEIPQTITYTPGGFDPGNDQFPDVQVALRRNPEGGYVLLAANTRYYPVDTTFGLDFLGKDGEVKRLFSPAKHKIGAGAFRDRLECMDTRAYLIAAPALSNLPVKISVQMTAHPDQADPVYGAPAMPDSGRPGKRNIMRNPGFEEVSLPDWPDYYLLPGGPRLGVRTENSNRGIDTRNPYEGKNCWWMRGAPIMIYGACSPKVKEPTEYVLSAYLRADRDGVKVRFRGFGWLVPKETFGAKEFTLTTKWERYWEKGVLPPGLPDWHSLAVVVQGGQDPATVWVDAIQFEQGAEPTEYEP